MTDLSVERLCGELLHLGQRAEGPEAFWRGAMLAVRRAIPFDCAIARLGADVYGQRECSACRQPRTGLPARAPLEFQARRMGYLEVIRHGGCSFTPRERQLLEAAAPALSVVNAALSPPARGDELDWLAANLKTLSPREREVAWWVAQGHTDRQVALQLGKATNTVRNQVAMVFSKLGISSRVQLARAFVRLGVQREELRPLAS